MKSLKWDNDKTNYMLHHYTSIDSLAMILKNKTIKLNRLDLSNDPLEKNARDIENLGKFFFYSSWTKSDEESIPMWRMYASNPIEYGVRISLPRYFFKIWHKDFNEPVTYDILSFQQIPGSMSKDVISIMEPGKELALYQDHGFHLIYELPNNRFPFEMEYVESEEELEQKYYQLHTKENRNINILTVPGSLGKNKHRRWEYENEYRYLVEIYHNDLLPLANISKEEVSEAKSRYILIAKEYEPPFKDFILEIHESAFKKMIITLNPMVTKGIRFLIKSLTENFQNKTGIQIQINDSELKDRIIIK